MAKKLYPEESVQAIADAIRGKNGSSDTYKIGDMASAISEIPTGNYDAEDAIIQKTISGAYENSRVTVVGSYAFASCLALTTVSFPNVTSIYASAFYSDLMLSEIWLPKVSALGARAFCKCSNLMSVYLLSDQMVNLTQANEFDSTPMKVSSYTGSFGSIYVPASLVDSYKSNTLWSALSDRITSYVE